MSTRVNSAVAGLTLQFNIEYNEYMLDDKDIQKIIEAEQRVFATKEDLEKMRDDLKKDFSKLMTSVDNYAVKADNYFQEMVVLAHKVDRHEKWILQLAEKLGIKLEY